MLARGFVAPQPANPDRWTARPSASTGWDFLIVSQHPLAPSSFQGHVQDRVYDALGIEMSLRELAGGAAMPLVVSVDGGQGLYGFLQRGEAEHPFPIGKVGTRPGVLHDHGLAARHVAQGAVTYPGILKDHACRLGAAELAARLLDIGLVAFRRASDLGGQ